MSAGRENEVYVVHEKLLTTAERKHVVADLTDEALDIGVILKNAQAVLAANQESLANHATLLMMMDKAIRGRTFKTVYLDYSPKDLPTRIAFSEQMYLRAFQLQMRGSPADVSLDRLLILTMGVPLYLHAIDGPMFSYTALEGLPAGGPSEDVSEVVTATSALPTRTIKTESDANDHFQALEEKLRHNHDSLRTARRMRRRLHDGDFKRLSDNEIRERVLSHFWRPAKPAVRAWLNAELNEVKSRETPKPKPEEPRRPARDFSGVAQALLTQPGHAILFLHDDHYARFKKDFIQLCN